MNTPPSAYPGFFFRRILVPLLHRYPFSGGILRLANFQWIFREIDRSPSDVIARLRNGVPIRVRFGDFDGRVLYLFGRPDPRVVDLLLALAKPGEVFFDIGANHGAVGFLISDRVGPGGAVHLFEPQPGLCARIREAQQASSRPWIELHECGLLDDEGELELWETPGHTGVATFAGKQAEDAFAVRVPVRDLRKQLPPLVKGRSWGAKVDVEGVEMRLLPALLSMPGMRYLVSESSHLDDPGLLWKVVRQNGHVLFGVSRSVLASRLIPLAGPAEIPKFEDVLIAHLGEGPAITRPVAARQIASRLVPSRGRPAAAL